MTSTKSKGISSVDHNKQLETPFASPDANEHLFKKTLIRFFGQAVIQALTLLLSPLFFG